MHGKGPLDEEDKRRLVLKLVTQLCCMECGEPYRLHDFALVDRKPDMWVLSIHCRHCNTSSHVVVYMRLQGDKVVVDLTNDEVEVAAEWPPISADDVLDVHEFLQEFDGDFDELFSF